MTDTSDDRQRADEQHEEQKPTLDDHPGLHNDEALEKGKMMTASGSVGPKAAERDGREKS